MIITTNESIELNTRSQRLFAGLIALNIAIWLGANYGAWQSQEPWDQGVGWPILSLFVGQFSLCCAAILRRNRILQVAGLIGGGLTWSAAMFVIFQHRESTGDHAETVASYYSVLLGFIAIGNLVPTWILRWLYTWRRFTIASIFVATAIAALLCLITVNFGSDVWFIPLVIAIPAAPSLLACLILGSVNRIFPFAGLMLLLFMTTLGLMDGLNLTFAVTIVFLMQFAVLLPGGIFLLMTDLEMERFPLRDASQSRGDDNPGEIDFS